MHPGICGAAPRLWCGTSTAGIGRFDSGNRAVSLADPAVKNQQQTLAHRGLPHDGMSHQGRIKKGKMKGTGPAGSK
jgi:hypothetical protein